MQTRRVTVAIPTLAADSVVWECVEALEKQTFRDFYVVIVDNSGCGRVMQGRPIAAEVISCETNLGFGAAINLAARRFPSEYVATINDDARASPVWLASLVEELERHPEAGMAASKVMLEEGPAMDSAGMRIARDGTSKQDSRRTAGGEALLPSGSAALYRSALFTQLGGFEESFFLYCEDTDLGLRAQWAGWGCRYVPAATVYHRYSHSAGRASPLKAYLVERNRLRMAFRCLPLSRLLLVPFASMFRYLWHVVAMLQGRGAAAEFQRAGHGPARLAWYVIKAHVDTLLRLPRLVAERHVVQRHSRRSRSEFKQLLDRYAISLREVASL